MVSRGADPAGGDPGVPPSVLRSWDQAEARLFPLVMAQPEVYELALGVIGRLLERLRETCADFPALLAAHERGGDLVADLLGEQMPGVGPDLMAAGACAMRYRELVALAAATGRLAALARARERGLSWAVVEETGSVDRVPYIPYQRIEAEAGSGRAVIVSIQPDETLSRAVYRLDMGQIDLASGALRIGEPIGSYLDAGEMTAALRQAQGGPSGTAG
jgi:hypothetical protein